MARSKHTRTRLIWRDGRKVRAHRWIIEQYLGRKLSAYEHVHHINGNPLDNRIENLQVLGAGPHIRLHKQKYPDLKTCWNCGQSFIANPRKRKRQKCGSPRCAKEMIPHSSNMSSNQGISA